VSSDRRDWEERYAVRGENPLQAPSSFLLRHLDELPRGRALDVACGDGRHALVLARLGFTVDAIDLAATALRRLRNVAASERLAVHPVQADLEAFPIRADTYTVILNIRYLQRDLWSSFKRGLCPGGVLLFETFLRDQQRIGHPRNPSFLLERGELARAFADLDILRYEEGLLENESEPAFLARLLARRPSR
jgi:tellurite methyltransferase